MAQLLKVVEAGAADAEAVAALVNEAYAPVEAFLYDGPRTSVEEVRGRLARGTFLLHAEALLLACVYLEVQGDRAYLGMLSVSPACQKRGLGRELVAAAESHLVARGVRRVEIEVVHRRPELFSFYQRLGFGVTGERPFEEPRLHLPCHFVVMEKQL